ncbi:unnamed protein product [marine sediment metagenome]|uniref:Uncharacterized protein n=1 Tax=marine sediment metagenome TaxID=412755 RepID=X1E5V3_9ZZZZ
MSMYEVYEPVRQFEREIAGYCSAKYGVAVSSCSNAIFLWCKYLKVKDVYIPKKTYFSVPCSIIHAGGKVHFKDKEWQGYYQLKPYPIYDSAIRFKKDMYVKNSYYCLSFQYSKQIPIGRGGMILADDYDALKWFKRARCRGSVMTTQTTKITPDESGYLEISRSKLGRSPSPNGY